MIVRLEPSASVKATALSQAILQRYVVAGNIRQLADAAFREELESWIRFNPNAALRSGDGLAGRVSGKPALPTRLGHLFARVVITPQSQNATDVRNLQSSSGVAVLVATADDTAAWIETGRAYERFALQAAALNVRTAFINQPIEVTPLRRQFESWLQLKGGYALLMVRFGHGPIAPYSLRRPIDEVMVESGVCSSVTSRRTLERAGKRPEARVC